MERFIKNWRESSRSDENGDKPVQKQEEFISVEVVRASLSKVAAETLLAHVAYKRWNPKLVAYCKIYYEGPETSGESGAANQVSQVYTACTKKVEGIDLDFQWQWNFRSKITMRKGSNPRLELHLCTHTTVDIPTRTVEIDFSKQLKDRNEGEVQLSLENSREGCDGAASARLASREGNIALYLSREATTATDSFTDIQQELSCGVLRVVVYQAKALNSKYASYVEISLPHEPKKREHRTNECATPKSPVWDSTVEFDVVNLNGDLRLDIWESHTIRSDAPIGQVIVPLAWLVGGNPLLSYFEVFPVNGATNINRGGQYMRGADIPSGGDKILGYLRLSAQLTLQHSPNLLYMKNSSWLFKAAEVNKTRTAQPASLILLKNNMERMHRKYQSIYFVEVAKEILNWQRDISLSVGGLALHCYLCLLAPIWHVPVVLCIAIYVVGGECARSRDFAHCVDLSGPDDELPENEKSVTSRKTAGGGLKDKAEGDSKYHGRNDKSKSIQDRIRDTRTTATRLQRKMGKGITVMEKVLNLLMMADPAISQFFYMTLLGFSIFMSIVLYWIPTRIVFLVCGIFAFIPKQRYKKALERVRAAAERAPKRVLQDSSSVSASSNSAPPVDGSPSVEKRHGHVCSGFLFAVEWAGDPMGDDDLPDDDIDDTWTRRWCTLWSTPPTLQASTRDGELSIPLPGLAIAEYKELDFGPLDSKRNRRSARDKNSSGNKFDAQMLETLQAFGINTGHDGDTTRDSYLQSSRVSEAGGDDETRSQLSKESTSTSNKQRRSSLHFARDFRALHTFRLIDRERDRCWIFGAVKREEMESWMQSLIACGAVTLSPLELSLVTTYNKPYMYKVVKSLFELVPDDVDLEHRYICALAQRSAQQIEERAPTRRYMPDDPINKSALVTPGSGRVDGSQLRVSLLTAKALPFKEQNFKFVGPLGNTIAKVYAILFLVPESVSRDRYRSMSQARSAQPIWREDFRFTDVILTSDSELQVVLISKDPLSFSKKDDEATAALLRKHKHLADLVDLLADNESFVGFSRIRITQQYGQQAWYPIEPLYSTNNQAAILLEISVV